MPMDDYSPALQHLFSLGEPSEGEWPDYLAGGLGPEHVPELIRLALDSSLFEKYPAEEPAGWAPVHAGRALGQLRALEAVEPLLGLFDEDRGSSDYQWDDFRFVVALVGPAALPPLLAYLADEARAPKGRWRVGDALVELARQYPQARADSVAAMTRVLEQADRNDPALNGGMMNCLLDLHAVESAAVIEQAFKTGNIEELYVGRWEDVRHELGLGPPPARKRPEALREQGPPTKRSASPKARAQERAKDRKKQKRKKRK
jgi:hypothetical protein